MKQLNFIIGGQELTRTDTLEIVSDAIGQFEAVFTFDEWWNGFTPTAQFTKDGKTIDCLLSNNKCIVPPEALQGGGVFYVNVFSTDGTGDRKTANEVAVPIKTSGYKKDGSHSQEPSPSVYEQLLTKYEEVKDYVDESSVKNGDGVVASPNADFAEVAEWSDGNPNNEDRIGYFVCFDVPTSGIIMRKANADDDVKGITVSNPSFAGNCTKDKFDENGKLLPQYEYVGVIGLVPVHDNGQCVVGERCVPADGGIAAPSPNDKGYQVVERYNDNMILVAVEPNGDMVCRLQEQIDKNAKHNEVITQEIQNIKNNVNGVRVTYVDLPKPTPREYTYGTNYHVSIFFYITYFMLTYDEETKQSQITDKRTNLPPLTYDLFDGGGVGNAEYKCEFSNEGFMIDARAIEPTITEYTPMFVSLTEINSIVEQFGGKFVFSRFLNSPLADTQLTMQYEFRFEFNNAEAKNTFTNEFVALLLNAWCGMFVETYTPETTPEETISEVI